MEEYHIGRLISVSILFYVILVYGQIALLAILIYLAYFHNKRPYGIKRVTQ